MALAASAGGPRVCEYIRFKGPVLADCGPSIGLERNTGPGVAASGACRNRHVPPLDRPGTNSVRDARRRRGEEWAAVITVGSDRAPVV